LVEHQLSTIRLFREKWIRDKFNVERETLARLHFDEGLTNKELAERFNVSATTIKVILYGMDRTGNKKAK
jgi:transposase